MTAVRIYPDHTKCQYGHYANVTDFRNHYDSLPDKWTWRANVLEGHAAGSYHHKDGSYVTLCD